MQAWEAAGLFCSAEKSRAFVLLRRVSATVLRVLPTVYSSCFSFQAFDVVIDGRCSAAVAEEISFQVQMHAARTTTPNDNSVQTVAAIDWPTLAFLWLVNRCAAAMQFRVLNLNCTVSLSIVNAELRLSKYTVCKITLTFFVLSELYIA